MSDSEHDASSSSAFSAVRASDDEEEGTGRRRTRSTPAQDFLYKCKKCSMMLESTEMKKHREMHAAEKEGRRTTRGSGRLETVRTTSRPGPMSKTRRVVPQDERRAEAKQAGRERAPSPPPDEDRTPQARLKRAKYYHYKHQKGVMNQRFRGA